MKGPFFLGPSVLLYLVTVGWGEGSLWFRMTPTGPAALCLLSSGLCYQFLEGLEIYQGDDIISYCP